MAIKTKEDFNESLKKYQEEAGELSPQPQGQPQSQQDNRVNSINKYYDLANQHEYSQLADKEIQLENAKSLAMKYTNNSLANRGLAPTGYGASVNANINNSWLNAYQNAVNNTESNVATNEQNRAKEVMSVNEDRLKTAMTDIASATSNDLLTSALSETGITIGKNADGSTYLIKPDDMDDTTFKQISYQYKAVKENLDSQSDVGASYGTRDDFLNGTFTDNKGYVKNLKDTFSDESEVLFSNIANGLYQNGTVVQMKNGLGDTIYVKVSSNGVSLTTKEEYNNASMKDKLTYGVNVKGDKKSYAQKGVDVYNMLINDIKGKMSSEKNPDNLKKYQKQLDTLEKELRMLEELDK